MGDDLRVFKLPRTGPCEKDPPQCRVAKAEGVRHRDLNAVDVDAMVCQHANTPLQQGMKALAGRLLGERRDQVLHVRR